MGVGHFAFIYSFSQAIGFVETWKNEFEQKEQQKKKKNLNKRMRKSNGNR